MDLFEAMRARRSEHNFLPNRKLSEEQIDLILEMASLTPSGYNVQPWHFCLIEEPERKQELAEIAFEQKQVADASLNIVVLGDLDFYKHGEEVADLWVQSGYLDFEGGKKLAQAVGKTRDLAKRREMVIRNAGLVTMSILLAAQGLGLGACPMMGFSKWKLTKFLNLPERYIPAMLIAIGYVDENVKKLPRLPRKNFAKLVTRERFEDLD